MTWSCNLCTYENTDPLSAICVMCRQGKRPAKEGQRGGGGGGGVGIRKKPRGRPPKGKEWNGRTWVEPEGMSDANHHDISARSGTSKRSKRRSNRTSDPKPFVANENDTMRKIAISPCVEAEELVGLNKERYPGITLTSELRQNTTILVPAGLAYSMLEIVELSDAEDRDQGSKGGDNSADGTATAAAAERATTRADDEATLATATNGTVAHLAGLGAAKAAAVEVEDYARAADLKRQIDAAKSWPRHDELARDLVDARRELEQVRKRVQEMNKLLGHYAKLQKGLVAVQDELINAGAPTSCKTSEEVPWWAAIGLDAANSPKGGKVMWCKQMKRVMTPAEGVAWLAKKYGHGCSDVGPGDSSDGASSSCGASSSEAYDGAGADDGSFSQDLTTKAMTGAELEEELQTTRAVLRKEMEETEHITKPFFKNLRQLEELTKQCAAALVAADVDQWELRGHRLWNAGEGREVSLVEGVECLLCKGLSEKASQESAAQSAESGELQKLGEADETGEEGVRCEPTRKRSRPITERELGTHLHKPRQYAEGDKVEVADEPDWRGYVYEILGFEAATGYDKPKAILKQIQPPTSEAFYDKVPTGRLVHWGEPKYVDDLCTDRRKRRMPTRLPSVPRPITNVREDAHVFSVAQSMQACHARATTQTNLEEFEASASSSSQPSSSSSSSSPSSSSSSWSSSPSSASSSSSFSSRAQSGVQYATPTLRHRLLYGVESPTKRVNETDQTDKEGRRSHREGRGERKTTDADLVEEWSKRENTKIGEKRKRDTLKAKAPVSLSSASKPKKDKETFPKPTGSAPFACEWDYGQGVWVRNMKKGDKLGCKWDPQKGDGKGGWVRAKKETVKASSDDISQALVTRVMRAEPPLGMEWSSEYKQWIPKYQYWDEDALWGGGMWVPKGYVWDDDIQELLFDLGQQNESDKSETESEGGDGDGGGDSDDDTQKSKHSNKKRLIVAQERKEEKKRQQEELIKASEAYASSKMSDAIAGMATQEGDLDDYEEEEDKTGEANDDDPSVASSDDEGEEPAPKRPRARAPVANRTYRDEVEVEVIEIEKQEIDKMEGRIVQLEKYIEEQGLTVPEYIEITSDDEEQADGKPEPPADTAAADGEPEPPADTAAAGGEPEQPAKKKRGRPKGSKGKEKQDDASSAADAWADTIQEE